MKFKNVKKQLIVFFMVMFCFSLFTLKAKADFTEEEGDDYRGYIDEDETITDDYPINDETEQEKWESLNRGDTSQRDSYIALFIILIIPGVIAFIYHSTKDDTPKDEKVKEQFVSSITTDDGEVIKLIMQADPTFSSADFKTFVRDRILLLQKSFEDKDISTLKHIETDSLYLNHKDKINKMGNKFEYTEFQNIKGISLESFHRNMAFDSIKVVCYMNLIEYTLNKDNGVIIGDRKKEIDRTYRLEFIRSLSTKPVGLENCPNCGAPLEIDKAGKCSYCHSPIVNKKIDWLINDYEIC